MDTVQITVLTAYNPDSTVPTVHACVCMNVHGPKFSTALSAISAAFCISAPSSTSSPSSKSSNTNSHINHHNCHYHRHLYLAGMWQQSIHWQMQVGLLSHFDKTLIPAIWLSWSKNHFPSTSDQDNGCTFPTILIHTMIASLIKSRQSR